MIRAGELDPMIQVRLLEIVRNIPFIERFHWKPSEIRNEYAEDIDHYRIVLGAKIGGNKNEGSESIDNI